MKLTAHPHDRSSLEVPEDGGALRVSRLQDFDPDFTRVMATAGRMSAAELYSAIEDRQLARLAPDWLRSAEQRGIVAKHGARAGESVTFEYLGSSTSRAA